MEHQSGSHPWGLEVHQRQDPLEQGYLAPPPLNYNTSNFAAMQVNTEQEEEQALSEPGSSASGGQGSVSGSNHGEDGGQEVRNPFAEYIDILHVLYSIIRLRIWWSSGTLGAMCRLQGAR